MPKIDFSAQELDDARSVASALDFNYANEAVGPGMLAGIVGGQLTNHPERNVQALSLVLAFLSHPARPTPSDVKGHLSDLLLRKLKEEKRYPDTAPIADDE